MILESVADKVHDLIKAAIPSSFVGDFPSLSAEGVAVRLSSGNETTRYFGGASDNVYRPLVTLVARNTSYSLARGWLTLARTTLEGYRESNDFAIFVESPAEYVGRDESKLHEFTIVFRILMKE